MKILENKTYKKRNANEIIYSNKGCILDKKIALTFDDGPNPYFTHAILRILKIYDVKATFFVIGKWCEFYPSLLVEIVKDGHLIGNHTFSHSVADFFRADSVIRNITGLRDVKYVRPPFYDMNYCFKEVDFLKKKHIILGDVDSKDYLEIEAKDVVQNVIHHANNGSIIDFHDGSEIYEDLDKRPEKLVKALPIVIDILSMQYSLVRIDQLNLSLEVANSEII